MPRLSFSSETYMINPKDLLCLDEKPHASFTADKFTDDVILLIGNNKNIGEKDSPDTLLKGKALAEKAVQENTPYIPVRIAFEPRNKAFDFISPLIRVLRYRIRSYGSNVYHTSLEHLRSLNIERTIRTRDNAFSYEKKRYKMTVEAREEEYCYLFNSIKENGFMDEYPIDVMVCRTMGVQDTINQGHHRISIALDLHIDNVPVLFSAAGSVPRLLQPLFQKLAKTNWLIKRSVKRFNAPSVEPLFSERPPPS